MNGGSGRGGMKATTSSRWEIIEDGDRDFCVVENGRLRASGLEDLDEAIQAVRRYAGRGVQVEVEYQDGSSDTLLS